MLALLRVRRASVQVELLSRDGCHLCDEALRAVVSVFGRGNVRTIDIASDRRLEDAFVFRVPVLRFGEHVLAEGLISRADARDAQRRALTLAKTSAPEQ